VGKLMECDEMRDHGGENEKMSERAPKENEVHACSAEAR
jgi:hypothetical protein